MAAAEADMILTAWSLITKKELDLGEIISFGGEDMKSLKKVAAQWLANLVIDELTSDPDYRFGYALALQSRAAGDAYYLRPTQAFQTCHVAVADLLAPTERDVNAERWLLGYEAGLRAKMRITVDDDITDVECQATTKIDIGDIEMEVDTNLFLRV